MWRQDAAPSRPVKDTPRDAPDWRLGIDLVVRNGVAHPLELDRAEKKLARPGARARSIEPNEAPGKVNEGDIHALWETLCACPTRTARNPTREAAGRRPSTGR